MVPVAVITVVKSPFVIFSVLNCGMFPLLRSARKTPVPIITKIAIPITIFFIAVDLNLS
jgi:hypothetical protein